MCLVRRGMVALISPRSTHRLLHLIHQPCDFALVADLAARNSFTAVAADQLNIVVRRSRPASGLHSNSELDVRDIRARNLSNPTQAQKTSPNCYLPVLDHHTYSGEAHEADHEKDGIHESQ